jgi:DHA1 family bicyclomycin/chloramphenicol resistance-like MFS transporter
MTQTITAENNKQAMSNILFMSILGALMAFTSLSTDIYLPAMPSMAKELNGNAELTITGFLIGFTFAQLIWGPISDSIGRKTPLYIGMLIFAVGAAGCAMSRTIGQIVLWRVVQAFGACTGPMLARAMIRDLYSRTRGGPDVIHLNDDYGHCTNHRPAARRPDHSCEHLAQHLLASYGHWGIDVYIPVPAA